MKKIIISFSLLLILTACSFGDEEYVRDNQGLVTTITISSQEDEITKIKQTVYGNYKGYGVDSQEKFEKSYLPGREMIEKTVKDIDGLSYEIKLEDEGVYDIFVVDFEDYEEGTDYLHGFGLFLMPNVDENEYSKADYIEKLEENGFEKQ